jgi:hypothetical protein
LSVQKRAILTITHPPKGASSLKTGYWVMAGSCARSVPDDRRPPTLDPLPRRDIMSDQLAADANKSPQPPLTHPGATPDAERAQKPPLPEPPYKPYAKKSGLPEPPYEPYKGM